MRRFCVTARICSPIDVCFNAISNMKKTIMVKTMIQSLPQVTDTPRTSNAPDM